MKRTGVSILILLLVAAIFCSTGILARRVYASVPLKRTPLRKSTLTFFSNFTISKLDLDETLDSARLNAFGGAKSITLNLSKSHKDTVLDFNTVSQEPGSLFAQDIDHDGDTDLIWSDLVHSQDVTIWLGDGTGLFEKASTHEYAQDFVINDLPIMNLPEPPEEQMDAIIEDAPAQDVSIDQQPFYFAVIKSARTQYQPVPINSIVTEIPSGRAPPSLLA